MSGVSENGSYVTRAELKAHLDPMKEDIGEIKEGVQALLLERAGRQAVQQIQKDKGARKLGWAALIASGLGGLWWVGDAVAKLTHHG